MGNKKIDAGFFIVQLIVIAALAVIAYVVISSLMT